MIYEEDIVGRVYSPLNVSCHLVVVSDGSPLTQVKDTETGTFEPNRKLSPTVVLPDVVAQADDGSWVTPQVNYLLANIKWYVSVAESGKQVFKDITTVADWQGGYEIVAEGSYRGAIRILRNLEKAQAASLYFEADIPDTRMASNFHVKSEEVVLNTFEKVGDKYAVSLVGADQFEYNPFLDQLLLYDYKVAHGIISASSAARAACLDGYQYEHEVEFEVHKGATAITSGYTVKLCAVGSGGSMTALSAGAGEVLSVGTTAVKLDLRLVEQQDYAIQVYVGTQPVATRQFSISRAYPQLQHEVVNRTPIHHSDIFYNTSLRVSAASNGSVLEYPECQASILWNTVASNVAAGATTEHTWNYGGSLSVLVENLGLGESIKDYVRVRRAVEQKPAFCLATDKSGNYYTDKSGNYYILQ